LSCVRAIGVEKLTSLGEVSALVSDGIVIRQLQKEAEHSGLTLQQLSPPGGAVVSIKYCDGRWVKNRININWSDVTPACAKNSIQKQLGPALQLQAHREFVKNSRWLLVVTHCQKHC